MWFLWCVPALGATWLGGDYGGADITVAHGDVVGGTLTNVGVFTVPQGLVAEVQAGVPLVIEADEIVIAGDLHANQAGHAAPPRNSSGFGPGRGFVGKDLGGGGGAGYGGPGGDAGDGRDSDFGDGIGGPGGARYGVIGGPLRAPLGSSGASTYGHLGGAGGGSVSLFADTIVVTATGVVSADGGDGAGFLNTGEAGSGGGSGGTVVLSADALTVDGTLSAKGGAGRGRPHGLRELRLRRWGRGRRRRRRADQDLRRVDRDRRLPEGLLPSRGGRRRRPARVLPRR